VVTQNNDNLADEDVVAFWQQGKGKVGVMI